MEEVHLVVGNAAKAAPGALALAGLGFASATFSPPGAGRGVGAGKGRVRAYVQVQNGCDHRCTSALSPLARRVAIGPPERVIERVRALCDAGFLEVVLTGVTLPAGAPT